MAGDWVYCGCGGSGTTVVAALSLSRSCVSVELDPVQVEHTVQRLNTTFEDTDNLKIAEVDNMATFHVCRQCREGKSP